jgi:hypothetical protein
MTNKNLQILKEDTRVVFSKYNDHHQKCLTKAVLNNLPETPDGIEAATDLIYKEMSTYGIALVVDSRYAVFDAIWDNLNLTLTETETNDESSSTNSEPALTKL